MRRICYRYSNLGHRYNQWWIDIHHRIEICKAVVVAGAVVYLEAWVAEVNMEAKEERKKENSGEDEVVVEAIR